MTLISVTTYGQYGEYEYNWKSINVLFLLGAFFIMAVFCILTLNSLNRISITVEGVVLRKFISGKEKLIKYTDIVNTEAYSIIQRVSRTGPGQKIRKMHLFLANGQVINLDDDRYENYLALVLSIRENIEESR